jgi:hypothetical protein
MQSAEYLRPIAAEAVGGQPARTLQQDSARSDLAYEPERLWKQVRRIIGRELVAGDGGRRAWHPSRKQVDAPESIAVHIVNISFDDLPPWAVNAKGLTGIGVQFHNSFVDEPCLL